MKSKLTNPLLRFVIIPVPPKIAPFDFGDEPSNFGDSASVQCLVTSGDSPIRFEWLLNGEVIKNNYGISIASLGKRNSAITIDSVKGYHAGNYTCQTRNLAATVNYTTELIVNGTSGSIILSVELSHFI